jgi:hypothetical protein
LPSGGGHRFFAGARLPLTFFNRRFKVDLKKLDSTPDAGSFTFLIESPSRTKHVARFPIDVGSISWACL